MRDEICKYIVETKAQFSLMIDESTSVANVQSLIVYVRVCFKGEVCTYFLGLVPLTSATACAIHTELTQFLCKWGLSENILHDQLVGFCSDGASCMVGQFNGVATLLKQKCPMVKTFHCMAHRLELRVKNAADTVNVTSHFRAFVDQLYKVYSKLMSPKNQAELNAIANLLSLELLKVQKVFDVGYDGHFRPLCQCEQCYMITQLTSSIFLIMLIVSPTEHPRRKAGIEVWPKTPVLFSVE